MLLFLAASGCCGGCTLWMGESSRRPLLAAPPVDRGAGAEPAEFSRASYVAGPRFAPAPAAGSPVDDLPAADPLRGNEPPEEVERGERQELLLEDVIASVHRSYPLLEAALASRTIAFGDHLAAHGAYDLKLKGASENGPLGFYETYRHSVGFERATYGGGSVFGGYRIGRGEFQPWYLERQTDDGGEFKGGFSLPLARDVLIDERRARLWQTELGQQQVEPEIRLQRIDFVRAASYAYWDWVAAGRRYQIAASLLGLAQGRDDAIRRKVETGDSDPPVLQDNRRLIVSREAKLLDAERKLAQSAIQLSLFLRNAEGEPVVPERDTLPGFPSPAAPDAAQRDADVQAALANRPELRSLRLLRRQYEIDLAAARNELLPDVQAVVAAAQDVGDPATAKRDKSEFELEAGLYLDVPLERRKARGKLAAVEGKLQQVAAKARMTEDKIVADVQMVYAALAAAYGQIERARESVELAEKLAAIERRKFELGESDLLSVNLREQQSAEAQGTLVDAYFDFYTAAADYLAALALE
jgi:outer membrane protein TolC